jgi:DNA-binding LytR/AlgR family response regulator
MDIRSKILKRHGGVHSDCGAYGVKNVRIGIKVNAGILLIDAMDIIAVEARGRSVLLRRTSGSHMLQETLSTIAEKLERLGFVRIHRSVLVNAALVEEIQPRPTGAYLLRVKGGNQYSVTRTYKKNLQTLSQLWVGTCGFRVK